MWSKGRADFYLEMGGQDYDVDEASGVDCGEASFQCPEPVWANSADRLGTLAAGFATQLRSGTAKTCRTQSFRAHARPKFRAPDFGLSVPHLRELFVQKTPQTTHLQSLRGDFGCIAEVSPARSFGAGLHV